MQGPTYIHDEQSSRIDHIFLRAHHADGAAKHSKHLHDAPFLPLHGSKHVPVMSSIPRPWISYTPTNNLPGIAYTQRLAGHQAWTMQNEHWQQCTKTVASCIDHALTPTNTMCPIESMHQEIIPIYHQHFPISRHTTAPADTHVVRTKWEHRKQFLQYHHPTLTTLFKTWYHYAKFHHLDRKHKAWVAANRKQKAETVIQDATQAAGRHDAFNLYRIINGTCPKVRKQRIQIRNSDGSISSPVEELSILRAYINATWLDDSPLARQLSAEAPGVPFTLEALSDALSQIPATKAVARNCAPGVVIKQQAKQIAQHLYPLLNTWWSQQPPHIPACWRDGHITFIPKPGKRPDRPESLRALAMQEPVGKAILGLITQSVLHTIAPKLSVWPQFAYLPSRSTLDPIRRAAAHCHRTRSLLRKQRPTVHERANGAKPCAVAGGCQLLLDLTKAFDNANRSIIFETLGTLSPPPGCLDLMREWHVDTHYVLFHRDEYHHLPTTRGVRQGCRAAPLLWDTLTHAFFTLLCTLVDESWIRSSLNLFADDLHAGAEFCTASAFDQTLKNFGFVLDCLEALGLIINTDKSVALMALAGPKSQTCLQKAVRRTTAGAFLCIPRRKGGWTEIRLHSQASYLGIVLSYRAFEDASLTHRLDVAKLAFRRMKQWLICRKLSVHTRLQLWRACIASTMTYGILAVGFTPQGLQRLVTCAQTQIRQILRDHPYHTGRSNVAVLQSHRDLLPDRLLQQAILRLKTHHDHRCTHLQPTDIIHHIDWTILDPLQDLLQHHDVTPTTPLPASYITHMTTADLTGTTFDIPEPSTAEPLHCQDCEFVTHSLQQLRLHRTKVHRKRTYRIHHPPLEHVMHEGLPQCTHCAKSFSTWKAFHTHVERGTCQALHQHHQASSAQMLLQAAVRRAGDLPFRGEQMPHLQNTDLGCKILEYIRAHQWQELSHDDAACKQLTHHCVVCGQWQSRTQSMNRHLREAHASLLDGVFQTGIQLTRMWATTSPCQFCGVTFQRSHMCAALTQVALIMLNAKSLTPETQALTCALCDLQCADETQLRAHLRSHTQSMSSGAWMPSRDQIPGSPACAHCGACFETSSGVQRHITSGQCPHYDATRTTEPTPVSPEWNPYLHEGRLADLWNNQDDRAQLTLCCQHCGHQAARPMDLMNHLRAQHGALWHEARLTLAWLISATADTHGCCCHPALKKHTTGHQCIPLAQLAMLFHRSSGSLCIPHPLPLPEEDEWMSTTADAFEVLEAVMVKREFPFLWTHPLLLAHLSTKCLQCNEDHGHRSFTAIALRLHMAERHASIDTFPHPLHRMLVECFEQTIPDDTTCHACQMVIQLPRDTTTDMTMPESRARAARVQEHFQLQCPVVYQSLLILTRTPQSNDGGSARDGCGLPDGPDLPEPWTDDVELPATMGGKRLHPKKATPTMDSRPRRRRRVQGTAADAPMHGPDGQAAPAPGDGSQHAQSTRFICDFFHSRSTGHVAPSCEVVSGLADQAGPGQDSELSTVADISGTGHLPEALGTVHGDLPGTTARRASPTAEETAGPLARCHMALHGVGCSQQCPDLEQASQTNQHGPDEIPAGGLGRICATFSKRCPISCLGPHPDRGQDDSLETPTPDDQHGSDQHPGQVGGELHLDSRGSQSEEACAKDVRTGTTVATTSPSHQREGEGQGQGRPRPEAPENCQATRQLAADDHPELCLKRSELLQACTHGAADPC
eukprot:Skav223039  [mRNA]  locus=scaffold1069:94686:99839:- [translate_table: standard]